MKVHKVTHVMELIKWAVAGHSSLAFVTYFNKSKWQRSDSGLKQSPISTVNNLDILGFILDLFLFF